jgi:hypothetical protein
MISIYVRKKRKKVLGHLLGEKYRSILLLGIVLILCSNAFAQVETATVSGVVTDQSGGVIVAAEVQVTNADTNITSRSTSNSSGIYLVTGLKPGRYRIHVAKDGFKGIDLTDLTLNIQDSVSRNFALQVGSTAESVTVDGSAPAINTESAAVSTVIDRQFAENLPMNGRSFQALIQQTPGVVIVPSNSADGGQFSINGQRAESNYWMVDGVSANVGIGNSPGNGLGGTLGAFSVQGGTNSLVSVDAMQEFRIQTSTYAPEFGRTPGGQISIVTRSGTNQFHGTLFDYLRNDALDANDWFNGFVTPTIPKAKERQNDFGGTLSGPVFKGKTFFFFSYEGLRLRLPQTALTKVPDLNARNSPTSVMSGMQPYLNAFPLPNGPDNPATGVAQFNTSFSNPSTLNAYSLRVDHKLNERLNVFARYNYSPSEFVARGGRLQSLSNLADASSKLQTGTLGATWTVSHAFVDDFRFNYSRTSTSSSFQLDTFGGAVPLTSLPFPSSFTAQNAEFGLIINALFPGGRLFVGQGDHNLQRQINTVNTASVLRGTHSLKFGVDFRRLWPEADQPQYIQSPSFLTVPSAESGTARSLHIVANSNATLLFRNLGAFAQDTWRIIPRLTMTYGLRWEVDVAPKSLSGPALVAVTGYNLNDFSQLVIAPPGTPPFNTTYGNFAPRLGLAYQLTQRQNWNAVIRGGFGVFYDVASSQAFEELGNATFQAVKTLRNAPFPPDSTSAAPPQIPTTASISSLGAFNPNLRLPYTLQWNVALEQSLGKQQTISASYVGAAGRRLLQTYFLSGPPSNPNLNALLVDNTATSSYSALQVQFNRRLSHGLQVLGSYSWAHSIDDGSAGSSQIISNAGVPGSASTANRGPSDFDIRQTLSASLTYAIPAPMRNRFAEAILRGWSLQSIILARSAPPVDISDADFFDSLTTGVFADVRPDIVPGQPLYLFGTNCATVEQALGNLVPGQGCPGGKAFNPNAFQDPPSDPVTGNPTRQGNVGRNFLRGFGATQWDFAVHRDFPIREGAKLQFRAEMFNVLNHPDFGQPNGNWLSPAFGPSGFGLSTEMLGQFLNGGSAGQSVANGAFNPLYQIGGPRSIQFALKFSF